MIVEFGNGPCFEDLIYSFRTGFPVSFFVDGICKLFIVWQIWHIDKNDVGFAATFEDGGVFIAIVNANPHSNDWRTGTYEVDNGLGRPPSTSL